MRILALSLEKNNATRRQVVGLARALGGLVDAEIEAVQVAMPADAKTLANNTIVTWTSVPDQGELKALGFSAPWPDLIVACRPEVAAIALGIKAASGGQTKIVQIQDSNDKTGTYHFDRADFDLIVKQSQEAVTGNNVISSNLPLHDLTPENLAQWREEGLAKFPLYQTRPVAIVLIGGSDEHVSLDEKDFSNFGSDIAELSKITGDVFVLSSRRTSDAQKTAFKNAVGDLLIDPAQSLADDKWKPRVFFDHRDLKYNEALGIGSAFISDAGSGSMGAEVEFTGMPWTFYSYRGKLDQHPQMKVWPKVQIAEFPLFGPPQEIGSADEAPAIARQVVDLLHLPGKPKLASFTPV